MEKNMRNTKFPITATFIDEITHDIPSHNWSDEQWVQDLDNMQEVGIDTVVFIRGAYNNKTVYPSKVFPTLKEEGEDLPELIMTEADKRGMKVYMVLAITNSNWGCGNYRQEIEKNKKFIAEVMQRYGEHTSFEGWYLPHEEGRNVHNIKETMGGLAALCKDKTPDKNVFISPYYFSPVISSAYGFSPERCFEEWDDILEKCGKDIDICAFQDGTAPLGQYEEYLILTKKLLEKYDIRFWVNVETFERDVRQMYYPIPFDVLREKIRIARPYVEKMITFEFSHFMSPQSMYTSAKNLNNLYKKYYNK